MAYKTVLLDYGHGGMIAGRYQTAGKRYYFTSDGSESRDKVIRTVYEGVVNRKIAALLANKLMKAGVKVLDCVARKKLTGPVTAEELEQKDVSLRDRVTYANNNARSAFMVSVHANAIGSTDTGGSVGVRGFIVFTSKGQTKSDPIAESIADAMAEHAKLRVRRETSDHDADYERDFYVLRKTVCPAVLTENGFFTNWHDAEYMLSAEGQEQIAEGHFQGMMKHL